MSPTPNYFRRSGVFVGAIFPLANQRMAEQLFPFPDPSQSGFIVGGASGGGDYFLVELRTGAVFYWDQYAADSSLTSEDDLIKLALSFNELMAGLEYPPGDEPAVADEIESLGSTGSVRDLEKFLQAHHLRELSAGGWTVAQEAARYGNLEVLRRCLELGVSKEGLLHLAAQGRNLKLIELLVEKGADVNELDERGECPLDRTVYAETRSFLERLGAVHASRLRA